MFLLVVTDEINDRPKRKEMEFIPDVIVQVTTDQPVTRQDIKVKVCLSYNVFVFIHM